MKIYKDAFGFLLNKNIREVKNYYANEMPTQLS